MNIVKAQQAIEQLRRMLSNSANEQDKNIFAKLKSDLAKDAPINLKNKILKLEYLYQWEEWEIPWNQTPPEEISAYDINKLLRMYEEKILDLSIPHTPQDLYKKKLLKAKNNNIDFFVCLGAMVVGDTDFFPYRKSTQISRFFEESGYPNLKHDGSTRRFWVAKQLEDMSLDDLYNVIRCLFKKKYFVENPKEENEKIVDIEKAKLQLKELLSSSCQEDEFEDLKDVFDLDINTSLLFNKKIITDDNILNNDLELARNLYLNNNLQLAVEKIWDVYERIKSSFDKDKKTSVMNIVSKISDEITNTSAEKCSMTDLFFYKELQDLTHIGNNYKIRHSEKGKKELKNDATKEYLFFRVLNLINLIHIRMNMEA